MGDRPFVQPSVMTGSQHFAIVPKAEIERSTFDRSHGLKTTFDAAFLVPVLVDEMLPGDTFHCNATFFGRLSTPFKPFMDNLYLNSFFFFVPNRLLWIHWREMNGQQQDPSSSIEFVTPTVPCPDNGFSQGSLADYFGLRCDVVGLQPVSALPFRAYNLIWNEWFRDENLQDSCPVNFSADTGDLDIHFPLRVRGKRKDYFTGCLPWPQKGDAVTLPLVGNAPVVFSGDLPAMVNSVWINTGDPAVTPRETPGLQYLADSSADTRKLRGGPIAGTDLATWIDAWITGHASAPTDAYADLSAVTSTTINALRESFQMQRLLERDARGGTRYTELIRSHFGVTSPDARLQRPEYLGGGQSTINVNPVAQTSSTVVGSPQGNLSGFGVVTGNTGHGFTYSATEHGIVIGMVCVRADINYQEGINRMWHRSTRWDYYWPALAHLGEQAVLRQEIYAGGSVGGRDLQTFGYQERWAEYRYKPSQITGLFRSDAAGGLDVWHLALHFTDYPVLGDDFIKDAPPVDRVVVVTSEPHFLLDAYFNYRCARPMPVYSVPGLIDHF